MILRHTHKHTMTSVYVRSIMTHTRPPTPDINARLLPFASGSPPPSVEHWEPGKVFATLPYSVQLSQDRMYGRDVVFGASDGENVYMTGYSLSSGDSKHVRVYRDGGTMDVTVGVPTEAGEDVTHLFAVFGSDLVTPAMRDSKKKFAKLTHAQVLRLFRDQPPRTLRYIAGAHAHRRAMASLRRVRSRRR